MSPPSSSPSRAVESNDETDSVNDIEEMPPHITDENINVSRERLQAILPGLLASFAVQYEPRSDVRSELASQFVDTLFRELQQNNDVVDGFSENGVVDRLAIEREGRTLHAIADTFQESQMRRRIHRTAVTTDLDHLDYRKFCEILDELKGGAWLPNDSQLVVGLLYFKDVVASALSRGRLLKSCEILRYFLRYMREANMIQNMVNILLNGISRQTGVVLVVGAVAGLAFMYLTKGRWT